MRKPACLLAFACLNSLTVTPVAGALTIPMAQWLPSTPRRWAPVALTVIALMLGTQSAFSQCGDFIIAPLPANQPININLFVSADGTINLDNVLMNVYGFAINVNGGCSYEFSQASDFSSGVFSPFKTFTCADIATSPQVWYVRVNGAGGPSVDQRTLIVSIFDDSVPIITCSANTTVNADPMTYTFTVMGNTYNAMATDNCGVISSLTNNYNASNTLNGAVFPVGPTVVTWMANDPVSNASTCAFTLMVNDVTPTQVVGYEYWFDQSGQLTFVAVTPTEELLLDLDLYTDGLGNGLHILHLRFLDDQGLWSGVVSQFFTKLPPAQGGDRQIVAYAYWFDNDAAQTVEVSVTPGSQVTVLADLLTAALTNGLHTLHLRFRDDGGQWSGVVSQFFTKLPPAQGGDRQVVAYEYWFDNDAAQAVEVPVTTGAQVTVMADLPTAMLANGLHTLHLRFRDDGGQWSGVVSQFFTKLPPAQSGDRQVEAYAYWFDNDAGQAMEVPVTPGAQVTVMADLPTAALANGLHTLHLRFRDDGGQWSGVVSQFFTKLPPAQGGDRQVVAYAYWFDNDAGQAVEVPVMPGSQVTVMADLPTVALANGLHTLHLRFRDDGGQWSGVVSQFFTKLAVINGLNNKIAGYRYWLDLNTSAITAVTLPTPVALLTLTTDLDLMGVSQAPHTIHLQFVDLTGTWSGVTNDTFNIGLPPQASFTAASVPCLNGQVAFTNTSSLATNWLWNFGDGQTSTVATPTHTYSAAGAYTVTLTATDAMTGLSATYSASVTAVFLELQLGVMPTPSTCQNFSDGMATAIASNGPSPYTYAWQNGETGPTATGFTPGTYSVTATASDGCSKIASFSIANGSNLSASINVLTPAHCPDTQDGQAQVVAQNGIPPYSFLWSNAETVGLATQLPVGGVSATVTDANGCMVAASGYITHSSNLSASLAVLTLADCPNSLDGRAEMAAQNGVLPYTFLWSNAEIGAVAEQLAVGSISATVTDANGCHVAVSGYMGHSSTLAANINVQENPSCSETADGIAEISPLGGVPPFSYQWSNGEMGQVATQLLGGFVTATVTDSHGCTVVTGGALTAPAQLLAYTSSNPVSCFGGADGSAEVFGANGTPPYTFVWSNGTMDAVAGGLIAGQYTATVTDANGCQSVTAVTIAQPPALIASSSHTDLSCAFANDGSALLSPGGGTSPYTVLWSNGATDFQLTGLPPDHYSAVVTDAHGCTAMSGDNWVTQPAELTISLQATAAPCGIGGNIVTSISGGTPTYAFVWSQGTTAQNPVNLPANTYTVTATDAHGCTISATATVESLNHAPNFAFTGNTGFENMVVSPPSGSPYQTYQFQVRYFDVEGTLPQAGYPRLYLDFEGDGVLTGAHDQAYVLSAMDPTDTDPTDGKDYFATLTGIPPSPNYQTVVKAFDGDGCQGSFGPLAGPGVVDDADIFLFANDIIFSNPHPEPLDTITVTATVHNESDFAAANFVCRLTNLNTDQVFAPLTVALLAAHSTTQVSWTVVTPPDAGWNPMRVEVDATNLLAEPNELDNQAVRPYINGDYNLPGSIVVSAAVSPNPSFLTPQTYLSLVGTAVYVGTGIPLADPSCAGAAVVATLVETGQTFAGFTDEAGNIAISFPQPPSSGTYHLQGTVTDYTLEGAFAVTFTVNPLPCVKPDLVCSIVPERYSLLAGETVGGTVVITNVGEAASLPTFLRVQASNATPTSTVLNVPALQPDGSVTLALPTLTCPTVGTAFLQAEVDFGFVNDECAEGNNFSSVSLTVNPALPDITPTAGLFNSNLPFCGSHAFTYRVENKGGVTTGAFPVRWEVWQNGNLLDAELQTVTNLAPGQSVYLTFPYGFPTIGDYLLVLQCDEPTTVTEYNEGNNNWESMVTLYACPVGADLKLGNCQTANVAPTDPQNGSDITITSTLTNIGNATAVAPFDIFLGVGDVTITYYSLTINADLPAGQSIPVSFTLPKPTVGANTFAMTADANDQVMELNETNNGTSDALDWNFSLGAFCSTTMFWQQPVTVPNVWFSVGLSNGGQYVASAVSVKFEISGPGITGWLDLGNAVVNNLDETCTCPAGAGLTNPFTFLTTGVYTVRMTADPDNLYPESNEGDNVLEVQVQVRPDMRVLSSHIDPSELHPDPDQPVTFTLSYENIGFSNPTDSMELFLKVDGFPLDSTRVGGLLTGDHGSVEFPTTWSSNIVGQHVARSIIDHDEAIIEINEGNNEATRALVVGEAPNFRFVSFTPSNTHPAVGQPIAITAIIENNGDLAGSGTYQLSYLDDAGNPILLPTANLTLAAGAQQTIQFVWLVADNHTLLTGKMVNTNPLEVRYDDNVITAVLGGLDLAVSSTPELCIPYTGTAAATVSNGTPPYFYGWVTGQLGATVDGLGAGNYSLTVTDVQGLTAVAYFAVEHKLHPELAFTVTKATCDYDDGAVSVAANGGIEPFSYAWNTGATTASLSGLTPALYSIVVIDALGCSVEESIVVGFDVLKPGSDADCEVAIPKVFLETAVVNAGQTQSIHGNTFFPNGQVALGVAGVHDELLNMTVNTDAAGEFNVSVPIAVDQSAGIYTVKAQDLISGFSAPAKYFEVRNSVLLPPGLRIVRPIESTSYLSHSTQTIEWEDYLRNSSEYPYSGYHRYFKYIVELSRNGGVTWEHLGQDTGQAAFNTTIHRKLAYEVPGPGTNYVMRVRDFYASNNKLTTSISISKNTFFSNSNEVLSAVCDAKSTNLLVGRIDMIWDKSFPSVPEVSPEGVAADGVARIYLQVTNPNMTSVTLTLSDVPDFAMSRTLGKVMPASVLDNYTDEANSATATMATTTPIQGKATFWYVAPDDFVRSVALDDMKSLRIVNAIFQIHLTSGQVVSDTLEIEIVRPPLVLVHGLEGEAKSWDDFQSDAGLLKDDNRFIVNGRIQMFGHAHFEENAGCLIGMPTGKCEKIARKDREEVHTSLQEFLIDMRRQGYAANRVDYVCHSMGGCVLRTAITNMPQSFYRNHIGSPLGYYENYGKGYINKVITLNTPHNGTPLANFGENLLPYINHLPRILKYAGLVAEPFGLNGFLRTDGYSVELDLNGYLYVVPHFALSYAVSDLRGVGGVTFAQSNIRAHLIAGDLFVPEANDPSCNQAFESSKSNYLKYARWLHAPINVTSILSDDFLNESDIVVPVLSQLANYGRNEANVTVFNCVGHSNPPLKDEFEKFKVLARREVADTVIARLNDPISSPHFNIIPKSPNHPMQSKMPAPDCASFAYVLDSAKVYLVKPDSLNIVAADSTLQLEIVIADTASLNYIGLFFQGNFYEVPTKLLGTYTLNLTTDVSRLDSQQVLLTANYSYQDSCVTAYDLMDVRVQSNEPLLGFQISQNKMIVFQGERRKPDYSVRFAGQLSGDGFASDDILISIADTSKLGFEEISKLFVGKTPGETHVIFSYGGFQDTCYFLVLPFGNDTMTQPDLVADFAFSEDIACLGGDLHLQNKSLHADTYHWDFGDGQISTEASPTHQYHQAGYHQVVLTATNSLTSVSEDYSVAIEVEMDSIGVAIVPPADSALCSGQLRLLLASGTPGLTFQWQKDGVDLPDSTQAGIAVTLPGTYQVVATNTSGCSQTSNAVPLVTETAPSALCHDAMVYLNAGGLAGLTVGQINVGSYSHCGAVNLALSLSQFTCANVGNQVVTLTVTNIAGATATCSATVTVLDTLRPTALCQSLTIYLSPSGTTTITPDQINNGSTDNCGLGTLSCAPNTFTAADLGPNPVTLTVPDASGNQSTCTSTVTVSTSGTTLSGTVTWEGDDVTGVKDVTINLTGDASASSLTDVAGYYSIALNTIGSFNLKGVKNINRLNGVTAADVTRIQQHIVGINPITDPYKLVAADVNRSNSVSTVDASLIQQSILGNPAALTIFNVFWRFVKSSVNLNLPPWSQLPAAEQINLVGAAGNMPNQNFVGVKLGDVTVPSANPANSPTMISPLVWLVENQGLVAGQEIKVVFRAGHFEALAAYQFALQFDPSRLALLGQVVAPDGAGLAISEANFGLFNLGDGEIRHLWASMESHSLIVEAPVFTLTFKVLADGGLLGDFLKINPDAETPPIAYTAGLQPQDVILEYTDAASGTNSPLQGRGLQLLQNRPNPFGGETTIGFIMPAAGEARLRVFDASGRLVAETACMCGAGYHEERFDLRNVPAGVMYYELTTAFGVRVRKMVSE